MPVRVLIVDDEPMARRRMRRLLQLEKELEVLDDAGGGREAIEAIRRERPDLVLLDVQMPEVDGFGVIDALGTDRMPATLFVTHFNETVVRALDTHAIDYLLKPLDGDRFRAVLARALAHRQEWAPGEQGRRLHALLRTLREQAGSVHEADDGVLASIPPHHWVDRIMIRHAGRVYFVRASDIDWFEAAGNYVRLHMGAATHLIRETMQHVEQQLDPARFARIHRAVIVNLARVRALEPWVAGDRVVVLHDGRHLRLSRTYREQLTGRLPEAMAAGR